VRICLSLFPTSVSEFVDDCHRAVEQGYRSVWSPQIFGLDALVAFAVAGREVRDLHFGTAVLPTYPRHPMLMAQQAKTTQSVLGERFTLGIGLSHKVVIEGMFGYSFDQPAIHMRDYLDVLLPLVRDGKVSHAGKTITGRGQITVPDSTDFPVMIAAMAPKMLELAGALTDGTILWMTGPKTTETHIIPTMHAAAAAAGRPTPSTVMGLPVCVTNDVDGARKRASEDFAIYGQLPSYRAMLDREGAEGPADVAIIGDEATVRARITALSSCGATDLLVNAFGTPEEIAATRSLGGAMAAETR
jgi:F420-dependent oxidoreductase-like protein